jgi:hypothetical protein
MSIDPKELRLGNWVRLKQKTKQNPYLTSIVDWLSPYEGRNIGLQGNAIRNSGDQLEGIPLTSEILSKIPHFGRSDFNGEASYFNGDNIMIRIADMALYLHSELDGSVFYCTRLRSLHHLQNIYFAIEGHELTINL